MWSDRGKWKTCSHGDESHLDRRELDVFTNRGKEIGTLCWGRQGEKDCEETEDVQM